MDSVSASYNKKLLIYFHHVTKIQRYKSIYILENKKFLRKAIRLVLHVVFHT